MMLCSDHHEEVSSLNRGCSEAARKGSIRRRRTQTDSLEKRAERAQMLFLMVEVSAGRRALDRAAVAPGTQDTLNQLRRRHKCRGSPCHPS